MSIGLRREDYFQGGEANPGKATPLGKEPCTTECDSWSCPNMLPVENDTSMTHEHYACKLCGRRVALDYDEMR